MRDFSAAFRHTYALVVGIEKYELGDNLDGPAHDARRFADWLVARGVPHENIALLLSPLDSNRALLENWSGPYLWQATRERVSFAANQWLRQQRGELLYLFWGGHGVMTSTRSRRLFYADSTRSDWHHLVLESLLVYLESDYLPSFQKQVCFIDSCANYQREFSQERFGVGDTFPSGTPLRTCEQFVLYAAQEGEVAKNLSQEQMGLFSKIVLEQLTKEPPKSWPPDMDNLVQQVTKHFLELREAGITRQKPVKLLVRRWGGDETVDVSDHSQSQRTIIHADNKAYRTHFGEQLRRWRLKAGKAHKPFARLVGVSDTIIRDWEKGEIVPTIPYLKKIIEVHLNIGILEEGREGEEIHELWNLGRLTDAHLDIPLDEVWLKGILERRSTGGNVLERGSSIKTDEIQQCIADLTGSVADGKIRQRIRNLLEEYLGSTTHPIPFGGRDADLTYLDIWLDDPQQPPYFLLTAPAGRGKSALLVRWSQRLVARSDLVVLFFPVSIRFNTNLASVVLSTIVARLATLHKEKLPLSHNTSVDVWQSLMNNYLTRPLPDGRRLILILDGIDEAADWEVGSALFPHILAPGMRIILSARTEVDRESAQAWLRIIGWDRPELASILDLSPLTPRGVSDVLRHMSIPIKHLDAELSLADRLHYLSKGDPLLVRLYVDDLQAHGGAPVRLLPEDLSTIQPGLEGYFQRWWEDQRRLWGDRTPWQEPVVQAILNILACALGPLSKESLINLMPPDISLSTWALKEALRPLSRLVSGNGLRQGYAFTHFRLGIYFYEQLAEGERQAVESRFLRWGTETLALLNEGKLSPSRASPYIVQYYGPHLERTKADVGAFFALLSDGWRRAWEALEGFYAGFLGDVGRTWKVAERADSTSLSEEEKAPYLSMEILCALCQASVVSSLASTPINLLVEGVKGRVVKPELGVAYARQLPDQERRAKVLAELAAYLPEQRQGEVVREILEMIQLMGNEQAQSELLIMISPYLSGPSLVEGLTMARMLTHQIYRLEAELSLISDLPEQMKSVALQEILKMAQVMTYSAIHYKPYLQNRVSLVRMLGELSRYAAEPLREALLLDALNITQGIIEDSKKSEHYYMQSEAFIALSPYLSEPQLQEIITVAKALQFNRYRVYAYIARYLSNPLKSEVVQQVLQASRDMKHEGHLSEILIALIPAIDKHYLKDILIAVRAMQNDTYRIRVLVQLLHSVSLESRKELIQEALKTAKGVKNPRFKAQAFLELIPFFVGHEKDTRVQETLVAAREIKNKVSQAETLVRVAPYIQKELQSETVEEALKIIQSIEDERYQAYLIATLVPYAPSKLRDNLSQRALSLGRATREARLRLQALIDIIEFLPEPFSEEALQEVLALIRTERDEREQSQFLRSLAPLLSEKYQQEVLSITLGMNNERHKLLGLASLVSSLPEQQKNKTILEILAAIQTIDDEKYQAQVIDQIVPYVGEPELLDVLQIGRAMRSEQYKTQTLIASLSYLSEATQNQVAQEALLSVRAIPQHQIEERFLIHILKVLATYSTEALIEEALERAWATKHSNSQARGLADLVLSVAEPEKNTIIHHLATMIHTIDLESLRTVLSALTPALIQLPSITLYQLWRKILHGLAEHTRLDLLVGLAILAPVISILGGENAVVETSEHLTQVSRWWP